MSSEIEAYIFCADIYCEACGEDIRKRLTKERKRPKNWRDETTYDSDEFPKGPYADGGGESDSPNHCGSGKDCLDPTILGDGPDDKVGKFLENPLTNAGVHYILENAFEASGDQRVIDLWTEHYKEEIDNYLLLHPKHPYHILKLRATLQAISNDCQRMLNGDIGTDASEDMLAGFISTIQDDHRIFCEVEDAIDRDDADDEDEDDTDGET